MSGCAFWISPSGPPMTPSPSGQATVADSSFCAGPQRRHNIVEHRLEDCRHARHHMDVADPEARRDGNRIVDVLGAARHARHALARVGELHLALGIVRGEQGSAFASYSHGTPNALATESAVMSSCVGPMPPVVNR